MNIPHEELTALLTLNKIDGIGPAKARILYEQTGSALEIFRNHKDLDNIIPGVTKCISDALEDSGPCLEADKELRFIEENHIRCLSFADESYPARLRDCGDAPLVLFGIGNFNLNARHTIAIVGTRKATLYGKQLTAKFVNELSQLCPDTLIISGLAFGIDAAAHKSSLENAIPTVGVLAHGLDRIYPAAHRHIAKKMIDNGGLITEFMSGEMPLKYNFVRRNRIVAGMADAVVVVESPPKGGSLITAELAEDYCRSCFAFPGEVGRESSAGCNWLIRSNRAGLIQSAADFITDMGWESSSGNKAVQQEIFPDLSPDQQKVMDCLHRSIGGIQLNTLVVDCDIPAGQLLSILLELEMKGLVKSHPGCIYTC